ncbi:MAG: hypothetical protein WDA09_02940, partial [Bacteriovoracaceae bacterium]
MLKCLNKFMTGVLAVGCLSVAALNVGLMTSTSSSVEIEIPSFKISSKLAAKEAKLINQFDTKM